MQVKTFDEMNAEQRLAYRIGYGAVQQDLLANGQRVEWCEEHSCAAEQTRCNYYLAASRLTSPRDCRIVSRLLSVYPKEAEK